MTSSNALNSKIEQRNKALNQMASLAARNQQDSDVFRSLEKATAELDEDIAMLRKIEGMMERHNLQVQPERIAAATATAVRATLPQTISALLPHGESVEQRRSKLNAAYRHLFVNGPDPTSKEQRDVLTSNTGASLIPQEFGLLTQAAAFYGQIANLVYRQDGAKSWKFPVTDDTANLLHYLPESNSASISDEEDPTMFSAEVTGMDSIVSTIRYSKQLAADAEDFGAFLLSVAGVRVGRSIEQAITLGTLNGVQLPNSPVGGILGAAPIGFAQTAGTLAGGITYAQLVALASSVDNAYFVNGSFMASPSVRDSLAAQVTTTGAPLYNFNERGNLVIAGRELFVNASMPAAGTAGAAGVLFGDFSKAWAHVADGVSVRISTERYADLLSNMAILYTRIANVGLVSSAVKKLVFAAS